MILRPQLRSRENYCFQNVSAENILIFIFLLLNEPRVTWHLIDLDEEKNINQGYFKSGCVADNRAHAPFKNLTAIFHLRLACYMR